MDIKIPPRAGQPGLPERGEKNKPSAERIFFWVFSTLIVLVVVLTFCKYFILKDYYIFAETDCDPYAENCFVWQCDPEAQDESEQCTGDPEEDIWYYQKVKKLANEVPLCDPNGEDCDALSCDPGMDCEVTYCDQETAEDGIICNDPVKFTEENPIEEEEGECAEDDEECLSASEEECAEDDAQCLGAQEEGAVCAEGDEECLSGEGSDEDLENSGEGNIEKIDDSGQEEGGTKESDDSGSEEDETKVDMRDLTV